jgi:hypothetical protein
MPRRPRITKAAALAVAALALLPVAARAVILPAVTIDGPSEEIVGFGGVAMAEDGSGGLVYLKRVDGVPHVFVARYVGGHWLAPIRVDTEEPYAASWPRIGAAQGGELLVTWATPFANSNGKPVYELVGAELGPGASQFGEAMIVDPDIEEATGTSPDLAVSSTGQADIVYRVIQTAISNVALLRPGDVVEQVRLAHFDGTRWSNLGPINRNSAISMRPPTQANAPQIALGPTGNGVVVWQEPNVEGTARIWARRIFGSNLDYVMPVSAESYAGAPLVQDADAPAVAISRFGQAELAYRQTWAPGSPLPGPRIFVNTLPDGESENGAQPTGAVIADSAVAGPQNATIGPPSVDIDEKREVQLLYDSNGTPRLLTAANRTFTAALSLGPPFAGSEANAASIMNPSGGGISAWPSTGPQGPAVAVREDFPNGSLQTALVSGGAGGPVGELAVGRSGLGDGLVAFQQGPIGNTAIVAVQATAPPVPSILSAPKGWIEPSQALVSWLPAPSADGPLTYHVVLDGRQLPTPAGAFSLHLNPGGLGSGTHTVQVLATDSVGQSTLSAPSTLRVDGVPPTVEITHHGASVSVRVSDRFSGVAAHAVRVSFGDGHSAGGRVRLTHRYARAGLYRVVVRVRDKLGNDGVVRQLVSVQ